LRGQPPLAFAPLLASALITVMLCWTGVRYFRRTEKTFADVI
jgi:hypothetical protein